MGKVALFLWLADGVLRRNPDGTKPLIFLSDGKHALHDRQGEYLPEKVIWILDLFHVLERVWTVEWCFFDEATLKLEAPPWVEEYLRKLLEGKVGSVIGGLRQMMTKRKLKGTRRKTVSEAVSSFVRNRERMKYDEYLTADYPIGSGVVEGACRHLVKDRMERTGMRLKVRRRCSICLRRTSTGSGSRSGLIMWRRKTNDSTGIARKLDKNVR